MVIESCEECGSKDGLVICNGCHEMYHVGCEVMKNGDNLSLERCHSCGEDGEREKGKGGLSVNFFLMFGSWEGFRHMRMCC